MKYLFVLITCSFLFSDSSAQTRVTRYPFEFLLSTGPVIFQGDVPSGAFVSNKDFSDFSIETANAHLDLGISYRLKPTLSARANLNLIQFSGHDQYDNNKTKIERNLSFRTQMLELAIQLEYSFLHWDKKGHNLKHHLYIASGISAGVFKPQAELQGKYYNLRPLGTEGQGIGNNPKIYSSYFYSIPFSLGYRYRLNLKSVVGFELSFRKSFTDYLDDVSTTYYDNDIIKEERGPIAAQLADRNLSGTPKNSGSFRGSPNSADNYSFISLCYAYFLGSGRR